MRVFTKRLEGNGIMYFTRSFLPGVVEGDEVRWSQWLLCDRVRVVVLPDSKVSRGPVEEIGYTLEPWNYVYQIKHNACPIRVSGTDRMCEGLE